MPRHSQGPRLRPQAAWTGADGRTREAVWVIRDGGTKRSTGVRFAGGRHPPDEALDALEAYRQEKRATAPRERGRAAADILCADAIAVYLTDKAKAHSRPAETAQRARALLSYWGDKTLADVTGRSCRQYIELRGRGAARRELEDLRAAINYCRKEGLCAEVVEVTLPEPAPARDRWLTRSEAARLIWAARRYREVQKGMPTSRRSRAHVARFILVALYTGTRAGAVCGAALRPTAGKGWIDLESGVFYRRPEGQRETKKRVPPVRLPGRLVAHLRRWYRLGICRQYAVEWHGKPVAGVGQAFRSVVDDAGLDPGVTPHVLRHTAATWLMQRGTDAWDAAGYLGMTLETLERTYGHHHPEFQASAAANIVKKPVDSLVDSYGGVRRGQKRA